MSWQANGWTANLLDPYKPDPRAARMRPAHVLVLTILSIHHDHHLGYAYVQLKRLAAETRLSLREIANVMNDLEAWDILVISYGELPKGKRGNLYYMAGLDDVSEAGPRRRLGGRRAMADAQGAGAPDAEGATDQDARRATAGCTVDARADAPDDMFQMHGQMHGQMHDSRACVPEPVRAGIEPVLEPVRVTAAAARARPEAEVLVDEFYEAIGLEPHSLTRTLRKRELVIAAQLVEAGAPPGEASAFVAWCRAAPYRPVPSDLRVYEQKRAQFLARLEPVAAGPPGRNGTSAEPQFSRGVLV